MLDAEIERHGDAETEHPGLHVLTSPLSPSPCLRFSASACCNYSSHTFLRRMELVGWSLKSITFFWTGAMTVE
jgi:hypothetical protein